MRRASIAGAAAALLTLAGCEQGKSRAGAARAQARGGVKVSLPEGWSVIPASTEDTLSMGPGGRAVLRMDVRAAAGPMPTVDSLRSEFERQLGPVRAQERSREATPDSSLVVLALSLRAHDAGPPASFLALLGAKRVGTELFLCATLPGASNEEVELAAQACRDLQAPGP